MDRTYFPAFVNLTLCLLCLGGGFLLGKRSTLCFPRSIKGESVERNNQTVDLLRGDRSLNLAPQAFSCNTQRVLDELTRLHGISKMLVARNERGEANRARTANLARKTGQAQAAEASFRSCVRDMMPELLESWERDLNSNKLKPHNWDEIQEQQVDGITFEVLQSTAEELDQDLPNSGF